MTKGKEVSRAARVQEKMEKRKHTAEMKNLYEGGKRQMLQLGIDRSGGNLLSIKKN